MNRVLTKYKQNMNKAEKQEKFIMFAETAVFRETFYLLIYNIFFVIIRCYIMGKYAL